MWVIGEIWKPVDPKPITFATFIFIWQFAEWILSNHNLHKYFKLHCIWYDDAWLLNESKVIIISLHFFLSFIKYLSCFLLAYDISRSLSS